MNLFYYIYYRFAHFYRRLGTPSPDLSAHNALCIIQLITILMLAFTCRKIFPQIVGRNSLLFDIIILCICPILHTIQWLKCRNMYDKLQEKWGNDPPHTAAHTKIFNYNVYYISTHLFVLFVKMFFL